MSLLATVNGRGTLAARPAAAAANEGYIYSASDAALYRSNGASWDTIAGTGIADQGTFTYLDGTVAAAPATPAAGKLRMYAKTGKVLAVKDDAGVETVLGAGGGGGALVFLAAVTAAASATLDFASFISSTYDEYMFDFIGIIPATNSVALVMQMGTGAGPTYDTGANYGWSAFVTRAAATATSGAESGASSIQVGFGGIVNTATKGLSGSFRLIEPESTARHKQVWGHVTNYDVAGFNIVSQCNGIYISTTAVTAVRFLMSSGNITSGTIRVYGVVKS